MQHTIPVAQPPTTLAQYLPQALADQPAWVARALLAERQVKRAGLRLAAADIVRGGEVLTLYLPKAALRREQTAPIIPIVYEDQRVLVANKPQDMASQRADDPQGANGALELLQAGHGESLRLCHRLDHHTGGLLLLAKDDAAEALLSAAFAQHNVEKLYTCQVVGTPQPPQATLSAFLRKNAAAARVTVRDAAFAGALPIETHYRVLAAGEIALLEVRLVTGRTHQIRAHLAHIGHPVLGDDKYGDRAANKRHGVRRQRLWATRLVLYPGGDLAYLDGRVFTTEAPFAPEI